MKRLISRREFIEQAGGCAAAVVLGLQGVSLAAEKTGEQPDILLFIADDMMWHDCQPYGNPDVKTPHMARLASEGVCFDMMFTSTAMCGPTRQQLYTGLYPVRNGSFPNHAQVYDGVRSLVHHLGDLGYRVGLINKRHYAPPASFPFTYLGGVDGNSSGKYELDMELIAPFVKGEQKQPYCLIVASNEPHSPWNIKTKGVSYDPDTITVPPYLVDCPLTRQQLCKYYQEITHADQQLGKCLEIVSRDGRPDNTLVIFTSEQGNSLPFGGKWSCYETGLKTSFIARWPEKIKPNTRNTAMTQYVDVVPTLVEAAGGDPDVCRPGRPDAAGNTGFDGRSFLKVLFGAAH